PYATNHCYGTLATTSTKRSEGSLYQAPVEQRRVSVFDGPELLRGCLRQRKLTRRISELPDVGQPDRVHQRRHHVRRRRSRRRLEVNVTRQPTVGAAEHNQRAPLVIVDVAIAHGRGVDAGNRAGGSRDTLILSASCG